jgi:hypothetical protein
MYEGYTPLFIRVGEDGVAKNFMYIGIHFKIPTTMYELLQPFSFCIEI